MTRCHTHSRNTAQAALNKKAKQEQRQAAKASKKAAKKEKAGAQAGATGREAPEPEPEAEAAEAGTDFGPESQVAPEAGSEAEQAPPPGPGPPPPPPAPRPDVVELAVAGTAAWTISPYLASMSLVYQWAPDYLYNTSINGSITKWAKRNRLNIARYPAGQNLGSSIWG